MKNNKEIAQFKGQVFEFQFKDSECRIKFVNNTELLVTYREPDGYFCDLLTRRGGIVLVTTAERRVLLQDALKLLEDKLYIWLTQFHT